MSPTDRNILSVFLILSVILLSSPNISSVAEGDSAPIGQVGGGSSWVLCNQSDIRLDSFFVDVAVDLPNVEEEYNYYLYNQANRTIDQKVVIPIYFQERSPYRYTNNYSSATLYIDGEQTEYNYSSVEVEENYSDLPVVEGFIAEIEFEPDSITNITLDLKRNYDDYTRKFIYVYSAKTGSYWNGTIDYGYFHFEYLSEYENITFRGPNGNVDSNEIISEKRYWDGNSTYRVEVNTGIKHSGPPPGILLLTCAPYLIGILVLIVLIVLSNRSEDEKQNPYQYYNQRKYARPKKPQQRPKEVEEVPPLDDEPPPKR